MNFYNILVIKLGKTNTTLLELFQNQISKSLKEAKIDTPNTQMLDRSL